MSYQDKLQARKDRYLAKADAAEREAKSRFEASHDAVAGIPLGQPILVGHHSEGRHRRDLAKSHNHIRKGIEAEKKAKYYRDKADSVGDGGISSDDEQAIEKLKANLAEREALQARMKEANRVIRKKEGVPGLVKMGFSEAEAMELVEPDFCGRIGFADYQLSNNNAESRRLKGRIKELEARSAETPKTAVEGDGYTLIEEDNRIQFTFDGKPDESVRTLLKSHAFKWSPSRGAWVRMITSNARFAAKEVREALDSCAADS